MGGIVGGIQVATPRPDLSHHGPLNVRLWGIRLLSIRRLGRRRLLRGVQQGRTRMVWIIRGVHVASGRQAGYGWPLRATRAGGIHRKRSRPRYLAAEIGRDSGER